MLSVRLKRGKDAERQCRRYELVFERTTDGNSALRGYSPLRHR